MNTYKKRIEWLDMAKGIAIILMVIGHTIPYNAINKFIFSFHMPLFVILSGFTYKMPKDNKEIKSRFKKYIKQLVIPYILVLFVYNLLIFIGSADFSLISVFKEFVKKLIWGNGCDYVLFNINFTGVGPIWFLIALFFSKLLFDFLGCKFKESDVYGKLVLYSFGALFGIIIGKIIWLPQSFDLVFIFLLYLYIGFILKKYSNKLEKYKVVLFTICFIVWTVCLGLDLNVELAVRSYPAGFLSILEAICASYCVIELCKLLEKFDAIKLVFAKIGMVSLTILCVHTLESAFVKWSSLPISIYLIAILRVLVAVIISFAFTAIKNKFLNYRYSK